MWVGDTRLNSLGLSCNIARAIELFNSFTGGDGSVGMLYVYIANVV